MAFPVFLELEIDGEAREGAAEKEITWLKEKGYIACLSYSGGVSGNASPGHQASGSQASLQPVSLMKKVDGSSPYIFQACTDGVPCKATFHFYHANQSGDPEEAYTVVLTDARITDLSQMSSEGSDDVAMESVSIIAGHKTVEWVDGSHQGEWPKA